NDAPVSYGALGAPIIALSAVTGYSLMGLSASVGHIVAILALLPPWVLIYLVTGGYLSCAHRRNHVPGSQLQPLRCTWQGLVEDPPGQTAGPNWAMAWRSSQFPTKSRLWTGRRAEGVVSVDV